METPSDDELLLSPVMRPGVLGGSRVDMLCGPEVGRVLENTINVRLENLYKQQWLEIRANMPQVQCLRTYVQPINTPTHCRGSIKDAWY